MIKYFGADIYAVVVPDLPGCVTECDSLIGAIEMGVDAASGWILGEVEESINMRVLIKSTQLYNFI